MVFIVPFQNSLITWLNTASKRMKAGKRQRMSHQLISARILRIMCVIVYVIQNSIYRNHATCLTGSINWLSGILRGWEGRWTKTYLLTSEVESSHHNAVVGYLARTVGTAQKGKRGNYRPVLFTFYALYNVIVDETFDCTFYRLIVSVIYRSSR